MSTLVETRELRFVCNRDVTAFMRDNGVDERDVRKEYASRALLGLCTYWYHHGGAFSLTHDGSEYVLRYTPATTERTSR